MKVEFKENIIKKLFVRIESQIFKLSITRREFDITKDEFSAKVSLLAKIELFYILAFEDLKKIIKPEFYLDVLKC